MADDLSTRSNRVLLPTSGVSGSAGAETEVIGAVPCNEGRGESKWRVVELFSDESTPWEATLAWSAGQAGRRTARVTVAKSTRVCIRASSVYVTGKCLSTNNVNAWVAIADGVVAAENEVSDRGTATVNAAGIATVQLDVPPFARFVRLELADDTLYASSLIRLYDGWAVLRNETAGDAQPNPGLPIGDSQKVEIQLTTTTDYRVTFLLNL